MPGSLAELYGALLKQEPQGVLGAARFNPLMMAKALRQQQANPRPSLSSLMNYPQTWQQFGDNIQAHYPTDSPAAVRQAAFEAAKNAGPLMTVWQGSPHRFAPTKNNPLGEFDATKIGSGEGAQAYGYGHYLAENKGVAKTYAEMDSPFAVAGLKGPAATVKALAKIDSKGKNPAQFLRDNYESQVAQWGKADVDAAIKSLESGNLYKVDLPDDQIAKMLDWDKPLSQQAPEVQKFFAPYAEKMRKIDGGRSGAEWGDLAAPRTYDPTGNELLRLISKSDRMTAQSVLNGGFGPEISEKLRAAGIPGIRYLDGGSRAGGQGTSNFVVFPGNEGILKILARE